MHFKFNKVYINNTSTIAGIMEKQGPLSKYFDKTYDDYYMQTKTFEEAEMKLEEESIDKVLEKENLSINDIDLFIGGDLSNQISTTNYTASKNIFCLCNKYWRNIIRISIYRKR